MNLNLPFPGATAKKGFDFGFGPFRWVCSSGSESDLKLTDDVACSVLEKIESNAPSEIQQQLRDNITWIRGAQQNKLVVGSQARILYAGILLFGKEILDLKNRMSICHMIIMYNSC